MTLFLGRNPFSNEIALVKTNAMEISNDSTFRFYEYEFQEASTTPPSSSRMELVFPLKPEYSVQGPIGDIFKQTSLR